MKARQISGNAAFTARLCSFSVFALVFFFSIMFLSDFKNPVTPAIIGTGTLGLFCMLAARGMGDVAVSASAAVVYGTASVIFFAIVSASALWGRLPWAESLVFLGASGGITVIAAGVVKTLFNECVRAYGMEPKNAFASLLVQFLSFFATFIASAFAFR